MTEEGGLCRRWEGKSPLITTFIGGATHGKKSNRLYQIADSRSESLIIPVVITVYQDRSYTFITKTPPAAVLLKKAAGIESGSGVPNKTKVAKVPKAEVMKIAELKMPDLNAASVEAAYSMICGTARSMGIVVEE